VDLFLIRHADAVPMGEGGITADESRPLTKKGEEQASRLASGFRAKGIHLNVVINCPLFS